MPGRHTTAKRPSRTGPILAAIVAVAVIVALGVYLAPRLTAESKDADCHQDESVAIAAPQDIAHAMRVTAETMTATGESDPCVSISVSTVYPDSSLSQISANSNSTPTIWILDSSARLNELEPDVREKAVVVGKAATTPIILVAAPGVSDPEPASWRDAFTSDEFIMHNPADAAPEAMYALAALAAEAPGADLTSALTDVIARLDRLGQDVPTNVQLLRRAQSGFGEPHLFPVLEQVYTRVIRGHPAWQDMTLLVPETGTTVLDYPIVVRNDADGAAIDVAEQLVEFVSTPDGNAAIAASGFRSPDGLIINGTSMATQFKTLRMPASLTQLVSTWDDVQAG